MHTLGILKEYFTMSILLESSMAEYQVIYIKIKVLICGMLAIGYTFGHY